MKKSIICTAMISLFASSLPATAYAAESKIRAKYNKCLRDFANEHLDLKTTVSAFESAVAGTCEKDMLATKAETAKDELSYGSSKKEADEFAEEDIEEILRLMVEMYAAFQADNAKFAD